MSATPLVLSIVCGTIALIAWIALPFVVRSTLRSLRDEDTTTGTVLSGTHDNVNDQWDLTVSFEVDGVVHRAQVDAGGRPKAGDSIRLRYRRADPSYAYAGTETTPWGKTIAIATVAALSAVATVVLAVLGYGGVL